MNDGVIRTSNIILAFAYTYYIFGICFPVKTREFRQLIKDRNILGIVLESLLTIVEIVLVIYVWARVLDRFTIMVTSL